jgi:hypothetical protein
MTRQSTKQLILNGAMVILVLGAIVTIAIEPWAQPIKNNILKHAPEIVMHIVDYIKEHPKALKSVGRI